MTDKIRKYQAFFRSLRKGNYEESQRIHDSLDGELERFLETPEGEKFFRRVSLNDKTYYLIFRIFDKPFER
ncbi:MAG: hypothetical protein AABX11_01470 [Nanoarchaeota archaeon]